MSGSKAHSRRLRRSADPDAIAKASRFGRRDVHHAGLFGEFAVEPDRAGSTVPGFDAKERRATPFRPNAEFGKTIPGHFDRWPAIGRIAHRAACDLVPNDRVVVEQLLRTRQR